MNKFLAKNKKKTDDGATSPTIGAPPASKKRFGRKNKEPERKPELDLATALPSSDNFRTSLLMPGLSTRFSMLREQDDPRSMLGKASDDSVLAPRRRSKMVDFSPGGLGDIAEIDSIRGSFRPPFASSDSRTLSYHTDGEATTDDDASVNGSIMSRARPGEGNVLFGGRQKIYKIPVGDAGSVSNLGSKESRGMRGRALYEDDVHLSAFQKYREQARIAERERRLAEFDRDLQLDDSRKDSLNSPALSAYDEKRATTSSTNSGPSMASVASTAPTSIISQPGAPTAVSPNLSSPSGGLQRSNSRRLYEQGLDQHMSEQQNAALTRLNSLTRKGSNNGRPKLSQSRSASNIRDRYEASPSGSARTASPLTPAGDKTTTSDSAFTSKPGEVIPVGSFNFGFNEPENPLALAVDRNDRGKATALGQFNRPKQFDEEQFLSRQRSLLQQRNGSRPRRPTGSQSPAKPDSGAPSPVPSGQTSASGSRRPSGEGRALGQRSRSGTIQADPPRPLGPPRARAGTLQSDRYFSRPYSPTEEVPSPSVPGSRPTLTTQSPRKQLAAFPPQSPALPQSATLPHLAPIRSNEALRQPEEELQRKLSFERGTPADSPAPLHTSPPPIQEHPAMRIGSPPRSSADKRRGWSPQDLAGKFTPPPSAMMDTESTVPSIGIDESAVQEPLNAPNSQSLRLGGFVREHLRHVSNVSSIYDMEESRDIAPDLLGRGTSLLFSPSGNQPWSESGPLPTMREDDTPQPSPPQQVHEEIPPEPRHEASSASHPVEQASQVAQQPEPARVDFSKDPQNLKASDAAQWMAELKKQQHTREASTETEYERRAFAEDLRQRQRRIQENLKFRNDNERTTSPNPSNGNRFEGSFKPFGLMRKPSSKESMRQESSTKGRKGHNGAGSPGSERSPVKPVGRTLHMKMSGGDDDGFEISAQETSRYRQGGQAYRASPTESSRPSTSPNDSNMTRSSTGSGLTDRTDENKENSMDIHRKDFPTPFAASRPSADYARGRANSAAAGSRPPMAISAEEAPPIPHASTFASTPHSNLTATSTNTTSPISSAQGTPTISATSSISDIRGHTNCAPPSILKSSRSASPIVPSTNGFSFPVRSPSERPAAMSASVNRRRSPSVKKGDISNPTLISSTSTFETMELAEKRAALASGRGKVAAAAAEINATSAATGETLQVTNAGGQPPSVPPMSPMRRGFFARRNPEVDDGEDEFMNKPSGGRLRIRKVSDENGFGRRHEAAPAGVVETNERGPEGGMF